MKIVCAWCGKVLTEYESDQNMVSHGICPECLRGLVGGNAEIGLREFLDQLEFPVLLTDRSIVVQRANNVAERAFGRPSFKLENASVGMAIECLNAQASGQCGRAEHCAGCVLRRTIIETHADGQPRYGMYSQNEVLSAQGSKARRFRFSATRIGDAVMLAIEGVQDLSAAS
jgi:hypothetical protein